MYYFCMKLACDLVIFTIKSWKLHVLVVQRGVEPYHWMRCLPWGFVSENEDCETCAHRVLYKETSLYCRYLQLSSVQSQPHRDPRWRNVSIVYYTIISSENITPQEGNNQLWAMFMPIDILPQLWFDHEHIIKNSFEQLKKDLQWSDTIRYFLPKHFPLALLQEVCQIIYRRSFEKRNFNKFIKYRFKIIKTKYKERWVNHRPAFLYKFVE